MLNKTVTVLLVDDDDQIRNLLAIVLNQVGYSVRTASDGFTALAEIRNCIPDIILSDLNMPGMSGFEFLSVVRRKFPLVRVIAMSGAYSGEAIPVGVAADAFYEKGANPKSLLTWLNLMAHPKHNELATSSAASSAAVWISAGGRDSTGTAYILLACPECLRAFPDVLGDAGQTIRHTKCQHCLQVIDYAMVRAEIPFFQANLMQCSKGVSPATIGAIA